MPWAPPEVESESAVASGVSPDSWSPPETRGDWSPPEVSEIPLSESSLAEYNKRFPASHLGQPTPWDSTDDLVRAVANDPKGFIKAIPEIAFGAAAAPGKLAYNAAADVISAVAGQPEYGGNLAAMQTGADLPVEKFIGQAAKTNPNLATAANIAKVLPEIASMAAANPAGMAGRLLAAGFSIDSIRNFHNTLAAYNEEADKSDPDAGRLAELRAQAITLPAFALLAGYGAAKGIGPTVEPGKIIREAFAGPRVEPKAGSPAGYRRPGEGGPTYPTAGETPPPSPVPPSPSPVPPEPALARNLGTAGAASAIGDQRRLSIVQRMAAGEPIASGDLLPGEASALLEPAGYKLNPDNVWVRQSALDQPLSQIGNVGPWRPPEVAASGLRPDADTLPAPTTEQPAKPSPAEASAQSIEPAAPLGAGEIQSAIRNPQSAIEEPVGPGMGGAIPSEFSPPSIENEINPALRPAVAGPTPTQSFLQRAAGLFTGRGQAGGSALDAVRGWIGTVAGKTMPKTTLRDRQLGELGGRWAASTVSAAPQADLFVNDVLAGLPVDPVKFDAALKADNLLSIKQGFMKDAERLAAEARDKPDEEASKLNQASADAMANAAAVNTLLGSKNFPFADASSLKDYFAQPEVAEAVKRHVENWNAVIEPMYRTAAGIDPTLELPSRGLFSGARVNLNPILEGEYQPSGPVVGAQPGGTLTGTFRRKTPFARKAYGTGVKYVLNYAETMANTFAKQLEIANKRAFEDQLVATGNARIEDVGRRLQLEDGEATKAFPLIRKGFVNKNIYVRQSLATEYAHAANVVLNPYRGNLLVGANAAFAKAALAGLTDATVHIENLGTSAFQIPGGSGTPLLVDALLSAAGRLDVPLAIARAGIKLAPEIGRTQFYQKFLADRLPAAITNAVNRGLLKNVTQLAALAQMNGARGAHLPTRIPGMKQLGQAVGTMDRITRMVLDDSYKNLNKEGWISDSETARREFVNQAGAYNLRTQGAWVRFLRQTWLSPFVTAGRNFATLGVRAVTLNPGVEASSLKAAAALRANMAAKWIGSFALVGTLNYLITGKLAGRPGTPLGAVDTGTNDENGRPRSFNVLAFTGQSRALRTVGARGAIEAGRLGLGANDMAGAALRDISNVAISPIAGPGVRFAMTAATGYPPAVNVGRVSNVVPQGGGSQYAENIRSALMHANPLTAAMEEYRKPTGGSLERALATQIPRFTLTPGKPPDMVQNFPRIVSMAQANEFTEFIIHTARQVPIAKRADYLAKEIQRLPPELQKKAWNEVKRRGVFSR